MNYELGNEIDAKIIQLSIYALKMHRSLSSLCHQTHKTMQIDAKVIEVLPLQIGEGKNGTWKKQDIIVQTNGQYPKKICIGLWNDKIDYTFIQVGNELRIDFDIESRSYNDKWFTEVKAWRVALLLGVDNTEPKVTNIGNEDDEELPF
jgi:hypothetical protein